MRRCAAAGLVALVLCGAVAARGASAPFALSAPAERWVDDTLRSLTLEQKIGQLIVPSFHSDFVSTDSERFDALARLVREYHVGGFHVFGATEPAPDVLLNPA